MTLRPHAIGLASLRALGLLSAAELAWVRWVCVRHGVAVA